MSDFVIEAQERTVTGKKVNRIRAEGLVPATVYGPNIQTISVQFPYRPLEVLLMRAGGTNLIDVMVGKQKHVALAREVQRDVLKGTIEHVDFYVVDQNSKIRADIPLRLEGESPVVAARQGILLTGANSLTLEMLPRNLIHEIVVDLTILDHIGASILVQDLQLGDVTIINDPHEMIARVSQTSAARAEELEEGEGEEEAADAAGEVEVISKGKAEEEEDF